MRLKLPLTIFLEVALETPREKSRDLSGSKNNIEFYLKPILNFSTLLSKKQLPVVSPHFRSLLTKFGAPRYTKLRNSVLWT